MFSAVYCAAECVIKIEIMFFPLMNPFVVY